MSFSNTLLQGNPSPPPLPPPLLAPPLPQYIIIFHCIILYNIVIIEFVDSIRRNDPGTPEVLHFKFLNISPYYTFKHSKHHHHYLQLISYPASVIIMLNNCNYILNNLSFFLFLF